MTVQWHDVLIFDRFGITFSSTGTGAAVPRSGNPGYITGDVVVAGRRIESNGLYAYSQICSIVLIFPAK